MLNVVEKNLEILTRSLPLEVFSQDDREVQIGKLEEAARLPYAQAGAIVPLVKAIAVDTAIDDVIQGVADGLINEWRELADLSRSLEPKPFSARTELQQIFLLDRLTGDIGRHRWTYDDRRLLMIQVGALQRIYSNGVISEALDQVKSAWDIPGF